MKSYIAMNSHFYTTLKIVISCLFVCVSIHAQIVERDRPAEWEKLIYGGKFVDRFLPMPDGKLSDKVWGAAAVVPRYVDNGIEMPDRSFWGGNILKGEDGLFHLFVCGWLENSPKGHMSWRNSTVYHCTSDVLHGPYAICDTIGKGHNPEAFRLADGRYVIYVIGGYYIADQMNGPWSYNKFTFNKRNRKVIEGLSNLTFAQRQDGSYLMVCRGGGIWISKDGVSPYNQISCKTVYPPIDGNFEDPFVWRDSLQYHLIVNDWKGRIAYYLRSLDGFNWVTEQGEAYVPGISIHKDGHKEDWFKYERIKLFQDEYGRPIQANFAVIDTIKWDDLPNDNHSSKNICIPMNPGLRLFVQNRETIDNSTEYVDVLIKSEKGFNAQTDLDLESLVLGNYYDVNFGKGCKVVSSRCEGNDLIVRFKYIKNSIGKDEFAPKLIGKFKNGELAFGYAKLPYVNYKPAYVSAANPLVSGKQFSLNFTNWGLSTSDVCTINVNVDGTEIGKYELNALKPYESKMISLAMNQVRSIDKGAIIEIVYSINGREHHKENLIYGVDIL